MLKAMPGITSHNCHQILERCASIRELCRWSKDQIVDLIGSTNGQLLYDFLHSPISQFKS
jgi:DNA excision repair protein ERCC-4